VQDGLDVEISGKAYVEWYLRSCGRLECPVCYEKAAAAEAHKIAYRLKSVGRSLGLAIHVIVSPPKSLWNLPYEKLRMKMYRIAKKGGFRGGSSIWHPYRKHAGTKEWYFSPHFHLIGYGWIVWNEAMFKATGWVMKNRGIRRSVEATAFYQISHCGLDMNKRWSEDWRLYRPRHSITWFGKLAYNKLQIPKEEQEKRVCPICGQELEELYLMGEAEIEGDQGSGWFDADLWMIKEGYSHWG
jgi:hypothetical protein